MFGLSVATEIFQGSTTRTWNCVSHFVHLIWAKLNYIRHPIMPKSRKRHHSRSRSRSRSHSRDRSHEREEKHRRNDSHDRDRDGKRRKVESLDSPTHKRSVSSEHQLVTDGNPSPTQASTQITDIEIPDQNDAKIEVNATEVGAEKKRVTETKCEVVEKETEAEEPIIVLDEADDKHNNLETSISLNQKKLEITPKKVLSPKQIQKKLESEKKRKERQLEKEEKERKRNEERERIKQEKLQKKKEKEMKEEQKKKEREEREEQKKKEKEEKEELRKREREEKEQKKKEREEKEEQKRKEREQEKLKKQQEIEEKNKEKQKEQEKKQKAVAAFVNFFVPKKSDNVLEEKKSDPSQPYAFKAFEVKSDMKLPPARRSPLSEKDKNVLDCYIQKQDDVASYIKDLKAGKKVGKSYKTWPFKDAVDEDVTIIEDDGNLGETICEEAPKLQNVRAKFLKFHENRRPAYFGTWRKKSNFVRGRRPFVEDKDLFNYEEDSDDDWEEEEQGESLNGSDDEADKENEDDKDEYEVDNEFFVPHGHLSDDEIDDEEQSSLSPETLKQKLKLLKDEFDEDIHSKTHKLKSRAIGCIWLNKEGNNVDEPILRYLQPFAVITNGTVNVGPRNEIFTTNAGKRVKPLKGLDSEYIPMFLKIVHGNCNRKAVLVEQFLTQLANSGSNVDIKKATLVRSLKQFAAWRKCEENGPMKNKYCWLVNSDVEKKYNVELSLPSVSENAVKE